MLSVRFAAEKADASCVWRSCSRPECASDGHGRQRRAGSPAGVVGTPDATLTIYADLVAALPRPATRAKIASGEARIEGQMARSRNW
jgi:hypothetical protein